MNSPNLLDRYVTTPLALLTAVILIVGGCGGGSHEGDTGESGAAMQESTSQSVGQRPDPSKPQGGELERPEGWRVRLDRPDPSAVIGAADTADIFFVNMTPGWHITSHKSAILYHPASTAQGDFTAKADFYYMDPGERQREGYGIFFGGSNLDNDNQSYVYFLVRNTGDFLIKRRQGSETSIIQDWTQSDAVHTFGPDTEDSVLNEFAVRVEGGQVHFILNGENVSTHPLASVPADGIVGLRINHGVNVHVSDLNVKEG